MEDKNISPLTRFKKADALLAQKRYEQARIHYLKVLPHYPRRFGLLKNLGYCYLSMRPPNYAKARQFYARAYAINAGSQDVAEHLATCDMNLRNYSEAAAIYGKAAALPKAPAEFRKKAAGAYELAHRGREAEAAYVEYLERRPHDLEARVALARLYTRDRNPEKAEAQYRQILSDTPSFAPALVGLARLLLWRGQTDESLELYDRALRLNPRDSEALMGKGYTLLWIGRAREALAMFTILQRRYPQDSGIRSGLAQSKAALEEAVMEATRQPGDLARTDSYYRRRLANNPADLVALKALAQLTATPSDCEESIKFARKAVEIAPGDPAYELLLARSLAPCGQYAEAADRYRRFLLFHPQAEDTLVELRDALQRAGRLDEAAATFRSMSQLSPAQVEATLSSARALVGGKRYSEALLLYAKVLNTSPQNYEALQGKALILYYTGQYAQARPILQELIERQPNDRDNIQVLASITRAEEAARWAASRPAPDAAPQALLQYFQNRLAAYPSDEEALRRVAAIQAQLGNTQPAIQAYKRVLEAYPDDRNAKMELARQLSLDHKYDDAITLYGQILKTMPKDREALEALGRSCELAGRDREAADVYAALLAQDPSNRVYPLEVARLELRLKQYGAARKTLASILAKEPHNREARMSLGQLDITERRYNESLENFNDVLGQNPHDAEAFVGKARALYYGGKIPQARAAAGALVREHPENFDAVFLLANIERASGHRREARAWLDRATQLSPNSREVVEMRGRLGSEAAVTVTTSASYARELGAPEAFKAAPGITRTGLPNEDLRVSNYNTRIDLSARPQLQSSFQFSYTPTLSPPGPLRDPQGSQIPTTLTGTTVPWVFISQNTWQASRWITLRGGAGVVRFGPGKLETLLPGQAVPSNSATMNPLGYAGLSLAPAKRFSVDVSVAREAIIDTPPAVRLGVMEDRVDGGLNFFVTSRTELHLGYYHGRYSSQPFNHATVVNGQLVVQKKADHDEGNGGIAVFTANCFRSPRFSMDAGYGGVVYGFTGYRQQIYLGYYNPTFYQRHLVTGRFFGRLAGPLSYDFSGAIGVQQSFQRQALTRALNLNPSFTLRLSPRLSVTAGYTYYNAVQAFGRVRGNEVRLSTESKF